MDIKFNSIWLSAFCRIMDVRKDILPPREWNLLDVPARAGAYLMNKRISVREIQVDITIIGNVETNRQALAAILETDGLAPLEFEDRIGVEYMAVYTGDSQLERLAHTGSSTLTFLVPDPYGYGPENLGSIASGNTTGEIYIQGDADVFPEVTATFQGAASFYAISQGPDFLMVGESPTVEQQVLPYEQRILWDEFDSLTGWTTWGGTPDGGIVAGTMASNGYRFQASDIGTGTAWHGPAMVKALAEPLQDFLIELNATQISTAANQTGRVEVYLLDANGNTVAKLIIRDSDPNAYINYAFARIGQGTNQKYLIDHKNTRLNDFKNSKLRLRRDGLQFTANISKVDSKGNVVASVGGRYFDTKSEFQAPVTQVVIAIAGFGTNPMSQSYADDLKIFKLNKPGAGTVDQLFKQGDVLRISGRSGTVTLNDNNIVGRLNPQSDFFTLKPGTNVLGIASDGLVTTDIRYRSRWL